MKKELFYELLESVKQGAAILKGTLKPARTFSKPSVNWKKRKTNGVNTPFEKV
jgi:hypothetical protein